MAPRTRHLQADGTPKYTNRLARETSPYLLQHAHNPVDWRPWGEEAFAAARSENKPVFLSVGYSTCHWCHVMEEESFEDETIARLLNEKFICIKVDREERPDVDAIYMQAVQMMTQHGGWPMSVFLTPDQRPFYAGTYFPPRDGMRGARIGFTTIVTELSRVFQEERAKVDASAEDVSSAVRQSLVSEPPTDLPTEAVLHAAMEHYIEVFDARAGGTRRAPKFPSSLNVRFLLRHAAGTGEELPLSMAALTLEKMALGGIYDQVGGGFHRYSTDAQWLVPHFEKMLYDNALLTVAYTEAWQQTHARPGTAPDGQAWSVKAELFKRIALEVCAYVDRELSAPEGGFVSATDADSEGKEGTFFVWTPSQLVRVLGEDDGARAARLFDVRPEGNFEDEPHGHHGLVIPQSAVEGQSVLSLAQLPLADDLEFLNRVRPKLYDARKQRPPPLTDTKVLASWNGLMISAFARAGFVFDKPELVERAARAARFLLSTHVQNGKLLRSSQGTTARHPGLLEDHAFLAAGLVELFEATGDASHLDAARSLHASLARDFADPQGGFFRTPNDHEQLLAREKPAYDGAEPAGNSVAALTLLRLAELTSDDSYRAQAESTLRSFGALLNTAPYAIGEMLHAVDFLLGPVREVVILRDANTTDSELLNVLRNTYSPRQVLVRAQLPHATTPPALPLLHERGLVNAQATAYVCVKSACQLPVTSGQALAAQLQP
ncbi:MAG: thioredoxin domain-containing protein [Deltaproteobacteria bacterium]|nr:thioredoxin domain-containing protein [Deltaproteobacteria bacterium]